ncbi:hypothetical protein [Massilia sp. Se16.2.3]|uniref:hypothetical protein n=1 Tax=Massilia sp. Se16.2.3 TaxID=2709303 RepID=UPI001601F227|nr:hypothetical protein [Massilia sp. Se16.2.3]QNB00623.1 hypothetical protein G4G31_20425 [Massilia sp. Se16.2.3]
MGILDFFKRKPTPAAFADIVMKEARKRGFDGPMEFDEANFRILMGSDNVVNLHNYYHDYCQASRAGRANVMAKYANLFVRNEIPASFAAARRNLLPVLRTRAFQQAAGLGPAPARGGAEGGFATTAFSDDTVLMLAYDSEHVTHVLGAGQLVEWGVAVAEANAVALDNLRDLGAEKFVQISPALFASDWNDAYDSSRLLLPDLVHRVAGTQPVAMIPTRGRMLLSASRTKEDLLELVRCAGMAIDDEGRRVSTVMYAFIDGRAERFVPEDEEVARALDDLRRKALQEDYADQKHLLDQHYEKEGVDLFVASYMLYKGDDERLFSVTVWTEGVETLLPCADRVAFGRLDEGGKGHHAGIVGWEQVVAAAGHLMTPEPDTYPVRYRVSRFPELASLGL